MTRASGSIATALYCCTACGYPGREPAHEAAPPDMSALTAVYDRPTGTLDESSAPDAFAAAERAAQQIATLRIEALLIDLVRDAASSVSDVTAGSAGYVEARRICGGWEQAPAPADGNGRLELVVGFSDQRTAEVAWGQAIACEYLAAGRRILLYGPSGTVAADVRLSFGESVPFALVASHPLLVDLDATAEIDGSPAPADLDFRSDPSTSTLEVRVPVADGDVIAVFENDELAGALAANGYFASRTPP